MSTIFEASNGVKVIPHDTSIGVRLSVRDENPVDVTGYGPTIRRDSVESYLDPRQADALREFYDFSAAERWQTKRDAELGRWRHPLDSAWVVYPPRPGFKPYGEADLLIINEVDGSAMEYVKSYDYEGQYTGPGEPKAVEIARAYFEAHPERALPTENGVYVPATVDLADGPLTFVLYNGSWRATPGGEDAAERAQEWHTRAGLVRLSKTEDAS